MHQQVRLFKTIDLINGYEGNISLQQYLKNWFKENKNAGSRDRKIYSALVFNYFRLKGANEVQNQLALVVQAAAVDPITHALYEEWVTQVDAPIPEIKADKYFPFIEKISPEINKDDLFAALKVQPAVFIRVKSPYMEDVKKELQAKDFGFTEIGSTIKFSKNYPLTEMETFLNGNFEIQDIASQQTFNLISPKKNEAWWDCCAGSGGKSLMLLAAQPQVQLFVSDIRKSIMENLRERFERSGVINYNGFMVDLTNADALKRLPEFDGIIADVPCSGSGTWTRTPEWLTFFTADILNEHIQQQREIVSSICNKLKSGGQLIYLTCSVFKDENEDNIAWFTHNLPLQLEEHHYYQFSTSGGDTLFGARLTKH